MALQLAGSSPRVRGKLQSIQTIVTRLGLIPACAGKTYAYTAIETSWKAHPRVCGENLAIYCRLLE